MYLFTTAGISNTYAETLKEDITELKGELGTKLVENTQFAERYNNMRAEVKHLSGLIEILTQQKYKTTEENTKLKENISKGVNKFSYIGYIIDLRAGCDGTHKNPNLVATSCLSVC